MKQQENNLSPRNALQTGYELLWYKVRSVLGQGAFGITYLAQDVNLNRLVAIKEFLPSQYAMRDINETVRPVSETYEEKFTWGLRRFIEEARILDQLDHPNIVRVMNIFEANNTAYMVMNYEQGVSLKEILLRQKFLDEADLLNILFPVLEGLESIHEAGFIHRDIKPANIFIRTDGTPVLLDFGSARQSLEKDTHTLTSLVSPGYAPIEQYVSKSDKQGPWSDIYGVAATLYRAVTGVPPNDAITRGESLTGADQDNLISCRELADKRYSKSFIAAIDHGLAFLTRDRPQTISEWKAELLSSDVLDSQADDPTTILPQLISGKMVSYVQESLTETATKIHKGDDLEDLWDKDESASVELAHKQGFRRGLKYALVVLTLLIGGLFIGNIQKIQKDAKPGYVPQELMDTEVELEAPVESEILNQNTNEQSEKVDISEIDLVETPPAVLDEDTAAELEAEGKIIIINKPTILEEDIIQESEGDLSPSQETSYEEYPLETIQQVQPTNQEGVQKIEPKPVSTVKKAVSPVIQQATKSGTASETNSIEEVYVPDRKQFVEIEEVYVPAGNVEDENVVDKLKGWVETMVNSGDSPGEGKDPEDQAGGEILEN